MLPFDTFGSGYSWWFTYGYVIPLAAFGALAAVAAWRRWPRWITVVSGLAAAWSLAGLAVLHLGMGINRPLALPTDAFLASGRGRVLDLLEEARLTVAEQGARPASLYFLARKEGAEGAKAEGAENAKAEGAEDAGTISRRVR